MIGIARRARSIAAWPRPRTFGALTPLPAEQEQDQSGAPSVLLPPWIYPPVSFENIDRSAYVLLPAILATPDTVIVTFQVPIGRNGIIKKIANNFVGSGWAEGSADVVWRIVADGVALQGYENILTSLGNPSSPTEIAGVRIYEGQVVSIVAINNPAGASGGIVVAGQRLGGRLVGWHFPRELEEDQIWI